jgi:hypothetical protein
MELIKSYEEACEALKLNPIDERPYNGENLTPKQVWLNAVSDMAIITDALHIGNDNPRYYFPVFNKSGFGFSYTDYGCWGTGSAVGSRLKYATRELSDYSGREFLPIHKIIQIG